MQDWTHNGTPFRILNIIDEYTRECLLTRVDHHLTHQEVLESLNWLFLVRGIPVHIRSTTVQSSRPGEYGNGWASWV